MVLLRRLAAAALIFAAGGPVRGEEIGSVDTVWKLLGPNHKIVVEAFDDPDIANLSCWVSRPRTGGISGAVGLAEDPSYGSIACRQRGPVAIGEALRRRLVDETRAGGAQVFRAKTSPVFKTMQVTRLFDAPRNTVVYLIWSDRLIEGSPKSSLSVVVLQPWGSAP
jgi:CreA protein